MKLKSILSLIAVIIFTPINSFAGENPADTNQQFQQFILEKAKQYTEKGENAVGKAVDIVLEESPQLVEEFLTWRAYKAGIIGFSLLFLWAVGIPVAGYLLYRNDLLSEVSPFFLLFTFPIVGSVIHLLEYIQIQVAPRIYLIEEISKLL